MERKNYKFSPNETKTENWKNPFETTKLKQLCKPDHIENFPEVFIVSPEKSKEEDLGYRIPL